LRQHAGKLIRFDGEHHDGRACGSDVGSRSNAELRRHRPRGCRSVDDLDAAGVAAFGEPAAHESLPHVAEPDQDDPFVGVQRRPPFFIRPHDSR